MKRKKGLFAVVAALALSTVMATMAFSSGYVWNGQSLGVSATNNALVALTAGTGLGNDDMTASYENGGNTLRFDFGKGKDGVMFGLQPGSGYTWDNLFEVKNNSSEAIDIRLSTDTQLADHVTFTGCIGTGAGVVVYSKNGSNWLTIPSGATAKIKAEIWLHGATPLSTGGNSVVVNTRVHQ